MLLSTTEWGDEAGPPVLCLHGLTGHGRRYRALGEGPLSAYRVVGIDYRGHGRSGGDPPWDIATHLADLVETAGALGVDGCAWIGHSFGGRLIPELAACHPGLVTRAVLLDPALHVDPAVCLERAELARTDLSFATADEAIDARLADGSLYTTPRSVLEEEMQEHLVAGADGRLRARVVMPAAITAWSEMATPAPRWPACPTLVIVGERSWLPVDIPELPHVEAVRVPGGHSPLWDDFDETAAAIVRFLASA